MLTYLPFERAKRQVEAGDFSFEAIGALTIAHGEKLIREFAADPFAPLTRCPVCWGAGNRWVDEEPEERVCLTCHATGEFIRTGIFRDHSCSRCRDGAMPERCPSSVPGNCGEPMARND